VAAGITPIALGTDTGGSVRVPAALCGTFGLKVTHGAVPLEGVFPLVPSLDTVGPLADSIEGIELTYRVLSGDDRPIPAPEQARIGIPQPWHDAAPMADDVAEEFQGAVESLRGMGHEIRPIEMPDVAPSMQIVHAIAPEVRQVHRPFRERGENYGEDVADRLDDAERVTDEEIAEARKWQEMMRTRFADAFATVDFLLTPTVPVRRKVIGEDAIGDKHYRSVLSYFTSLVNHTLHPALAMPIAGSGEPPASLQAIGRLREEPALIGLGRALEQERVVGFRTAPGWVSNNGQA
jgi:aspartyl-tRNA(Asn)/glutamyl-tRNA(Gln) amidotransferase subunit A